MSLYTQTIPQCIKMLDNLTGWLDTAAAFAAERNIPLDVLLEQRLFPNMYTLRGQVQFACSNAALLGDRLTGVPRPEPSRDACDFEALRAHVALTRSFLADLPRFEHAGDAPVSIPLIDGLQIRGEDMATDFSMPNVYFHLTTAYGILRGLGVPLGKADFLGPMALFPAVSA
jgi:hypothetical protein